MFYLRNTLKQFLHFSNLPKMYAVISDSENVEIILFTHWLMPCTALPDFVSEITFICKTHLLAF